MDKKCCDKCLCDGFQHYKGNVSENRIAPECSCPCHAQTKPAECQNRNHEFCLHPKDYIQDHPTARQDKPSWEKEFDETFVVKSQKNKVWDFIENGENVTHIKIKAFIAAEKKKSEKSERERVIREVEGFIQKHAPLEERHEKAVCVSIAALKDFVARLKETKE